MGDVPARLKLCDLAECEAVCCHDGVYFEEGEEAAIAALVAAHPDFFSFLPGTWAVDGDWRGRILGRKSATQPHQYRSRPAHFSDTRCVFALEDGRCSLQVFAVGEGRHPWTHKPEACWKHPLRTDPLGRPLPPPRHPQNDPDRVDPDYPGFVTFTPCGKDHPDGHPWRAALREEIQFLRQRDSTAPSDRNRR